MTKKQKTPTKGNKTSSAKEPKKLTQAKASGGKIKVQLGAPVELKPTGKARANKDVRKGAGVKVAGPAKAALPTEAKILADEPEVKVELPPTPANKAPLNETVMPAAPTRSASRAGLQDPRLPPVGTTIEKRDRYGVVRCQCVVEEGGIRYKETLYRSLSGAAKEASKDLGHTNTTQNGFVFWGIEKPERRQIDPMMALNLRWSRYYDSVTEYMKSEPTAQGKLELTGVLGSHVQLLTRLQEGTA